MLKFSVLMSIYQKENPLYFRQALDSILNQTNNPTEIVIVKDGKLTQELEAVCLEYENRYTNIVHFVELETNQGLGIALQIGLNHCRYDFVARMDTDDIAKVDRFEKQIKEFQNDDSLDIIGSAIDEFSISIDKIDTVRKVPLLHREIMEYAKRRNPFNHMTVMFRKSAVLAVGNYQPFHLSEDYYLWYRLLSNGYKTKNLADSLVYARVDKEMFRRRGGVKYFLQELKLQKIFYQSNFITSFEYIRNVVIRMIARLIPNFLREVLYRNCMRT